ncbi:MAG: Sporulation and spore germination [Syntrophorhabdus sp. PtaU1.Bin050]|nr:MAG: Sporulation and spore germination [Syntrophorhabdus sp. PtaU1.Bin050]
MRRGTINLKDVENLAAGTPKKRINYKRITLICLPLIIVTALVVLFYEYMADTKPAGPVIVRTEKPTISLFVPGNNGRLAEKTVEINNSGTFKEKADLILGELKKARCLPEGLLLKELVMDSDGIMYLNFSKDLISGTGTGGSFDEIIAVYAITNSFLASFRNTRSVQFLVDWQPIYTLHGIVYTFLPMEFNKQITEE